MPDPLHSQHLLLISAVWCLHDESAVLLADISAVLQGAAAVTMVTIAVICIRALPVYKRVSKQRQRWIVLCLPIRCFDETWSQQP